MGGIVCQNIGSGGLHKPEHENYHKRSMVKSAFEAEGSQGQLLNNA